jgi:hypothetical protein
MEYIMFNTKKKTSAVQAHKRTRTVKVGKLTFQKRIRPPNAAERIENKESRRYYKLNKTKIKHQAKVRKMKVERNPIAKAALEFKQKVENLVRTKKLTIPKAIMHLKNRAKLKAQKPVSK